MNTWRYKICHLNEIHPTQFFQLFAYISTAYCHPEVKLLEEKAYPPPADPYYIIKLVEGLESHEVDQFSKKLLGHHPNTYTYTKALAEALVDEVSDFLPTIILRPSMGKLIILNSNSF